MSNLYAINSFQNVQVIDTVIIAEDIASVIPLTRTIVTHGMGCVFARMDGKESIAMKM